MPGMPGTFHDDEDAVRRMLADLDATPRRPFDAGVALFGGRRRRRRRAVSAALATAMVASVASGAVAQSVGRQDLQTMPSPAETPRTDPEPPTPAPAPRQRADGAVTVTYQDGTTVTWPGPRSGKQWVADPRPGSAEAASPRLRGWEREVHDRLPWNGSPEAFGLAHSGSGPVSYAWFSGGSVSALWAQGPLVSTALGPDPCSHWPSSPQQRNGRAGCRVVQVEGRSGSHPVVVHERGALTEVFSVRGDGTVVALSFQPEPFETTAMTGEMLARIALGLPDGEPRAAATEKPGDGGRVSVSTHCGVRSLRVDGDLWIADPPLGGHNPPEGWDDNEQTGRFRVDGDRAVFDDGNGHRAEFRRASEGEANPNEGCE